MEGSANHTLYSDSPCFLVGLATTHPYVLCICVCICVVAELSVAPLHVQVSWLAVGCYYLMAGKQELARRYLSKSTSLNRVFGPAWLAYGHSFAAENEHDQAMAAYFTASQLMKG